MGKSSIEWTDETWNPIAGCTKVSAGCKHCYAERMAKRLVAMGQEKYEGTVDTDGRWTGLITLDYDALRVPYGWRKPRRVFVNSMSDLFHEGVGWSFIQGVFQTMRETPQHTYQVLTKRPWLMRDYIEHREPAGVPRNVWLGTSVEDQVAANSRIPALLECPAVVRFLSCEPLLGAVDLGHFLCQTWRRGLTMGTYLDWVICGGESGPKARPMHPDWARGLRDQCQVAGVPFFFKQWGEWVAEDIAMTLVGDDYELSKKRSIVAHNEIFCRFGKHAAGRVLDGREWNGLPGDEYAE